MKNPVSFEHLNDSRLQNKSYVSARAVPPESSIAPVAFTAVSTISTLAILYFLTTQEKRSNKFKSYSHEGRSTPLPGYGILGDRVNEFIELFLDALAVYVNKDNDCQRRMLCEANQRASDYGLFQGVLMYFLSLGVSLFLPNQRVSESLEAMKLGRHGNDCTSLYHTCPYSL